jgi:hypothetical protein
MHEQRTQPPRGPGYPRRRAVRHYRTSAEALRAAGELEALAEDEVSELRRQGLEARADVRADAWSRQIAIALGEAEALKQTVSRDHLQRFTKTAAKQDTRIAFWSRSPASLLALSGLSLVGLVALARLIDHLSPELLSLAATLFALAFLCKSNGAGRRRRRHGG